MHGDCGVVMELWSLFSTRLELLFTDLLTSDVRSGTCPEPVRMQGAEADILHDGDRHGLRPFIVP